MSPRDRDKFEPKHRSTPTAGVPVIVDPDAETSAAIEDPDRRRAWRRAKPTEDRVDRLEDHVDDLRTEQAAQGKTLAKVEGHLEAIHTIAAGEASARKEREERELRESQARTKILEDLAKRRSALWRLVVLKVLAPIAIGLGALLTARYAMSSAPAAPAPAPHEAAP